MRNDFNRVLTEDPRRGGQKFHDVRRSKGNDVFDEEFAGGKESMMRRRRIAKGERKRFGDHLAPLEGWVRKQVGRNWDDVYSEVCKLFDRRSQIKDHVHQHLLRDFVELNTKFIDGKVCVLSRWDGWTEITSDYRRYTFYVHPVTKILCSTEKQREPGAAKRDEAKAEEAVAKVFRKHGDHHMFFVDGVWWVYEIKTRPGVVKIYERPMNVSFYDWHKMELAEREQIGVVVWVHPQHPEVHAPFVSYSFKRKHCLPRSKYYASAKIASRKILKLHGLVGTATYDEDAVKPRSHREMSKYR
jgi:hypothetical protein